MLIESAIRATNFGTQPNSGAISTLAHTIINTLSRQRYFHLHLVSDATGETLVSVGRAAAAQYAATHAIEHIHSRVRTPSQAEQVARAIEEAPGIVLYTLIDNETATTLEEECRALGVPTVSVLDPVLGAFQSYLGTRSAGRIGAQHVLDADYFKRIDALNFTMAHDDGALPDDIDEAEIVIVGVSRTSKTPTSIYLANRGIKTTNLPLVPGIQLPEKLARAQKPLIIGLVASPDRIVQVRQHRILGMTASERPDAYTDRVKVAEEIAESRRLCAKMGWPVIDVTRRSIEETAAAIIGIWTERQQQND